MEVTRDSGSVFRFAGLLQHIFPADVYAVRLQTRGILKTGISYRRSKTPRHQPHIGSVRLSFCSDRASIIATKLVITANRGICNKRNQQDIRESAIHAYRKLANATAQH